MTSHNPIKLIIALLLSSLSSSLIMAQEPPKAFVKGLELISKNANEAKTYFLAAQTEDSLFHGTYHFLGVLYLDENKLDSAVYCFNQAIALNPTNANKTKEMAYIRLVDVYLYQHDFERAFSTAWDAFQQYPDNLTIKQNLQDVCLWSFYVKHNGLDINYMSKDLINEYIVRSISEEYLIIRRKMVDGAHLYVESQSTTQNNNVFYDILSCTLSNGNKFDVRFALDWNLNKDFGGSVVNTDDVYTNSSNSVAERIGALLVFNSRINLKAEIEKIN